MAANLEKKKRKKKRRYDSEKEKGRSEKKRNGGNKRARKQRAERSVVDPSFSRIPLIYILSWRSEEERVKKKKKGGRREAARSREGGRMISAVCMRDRRQTLLNCPMTPYILFSEHAPSLSFYDSTLSTLSPLSSRYTDLEETDSLPSLSFENSVRVGARILQL